MNKGLLIIEISYFVCSDILLILIMPEVVVSFCGPASAYFFQLSFNKLFIGAFYPRQLLSDISYLIHKHSYSFILVCISGLFGFYLSDHHFLTVVGIFDLPHHFFQPRNFS